MNSLDSAIVYDIESFPNVFTFSMESLFYDTKAVWEISDYRNDVRELMQFWQYLSQIQAFMIGFNNLHYDYPMIDWIFRNPNITAQEIRMRNDAIFASKDRFEFSTWPNERFAPQIDLRTLHHFDNVAKMQSLKGLQINMRSPNVVEMELGFERPLTWQETNELAIPYNFHDVSETKKFAHHSMTAINFRQSLIPEYGIEVMNWNDTKIGEQLVIKRLGDKLCYDRSSGRKVKRQTPRFKIAFNDIIFPYVQFENPEFQNIVNQLRQKTIRAEEVGISEDGVPTIKTKGVFKGLCADVGGVKFHFGTGGIHGSVEKKRIISTDEYAIIDIDVEGQYPNVAIKNNLAPAHLGNAFCQVYSQIPLERKKWKIEKGPKCIEANALKLAANGVYGKSNSKFSPFYDPQFTMTITINGQLMIAMLVEKLVKIPTLQIIQANTDGVTYYIKRDQQPQAELVCQEWERITALTLEYAEYNRMFIRDVNSYIAEDMEGEMKLKGAYWTPDPLNYAESISSCQPPAWHKNLSNCVSPRAAIAHMLYGVDIEQFIRMCSDPYDFMVMKKAKGKSKFFWGDKEIQKNTRFYVSTDGKDLVKVSPPAEKNKLGAYKRRNGVSEKEYLQVMEANDWQWDERVCTKNKSKYEITRTSQLAGYKATVTNDVSHFRFDNINYAWYVNEAQKLVV